MADSRQLLHLQSRVLCRVCGANGQELIIVEYDKNTHQRLGGPNPVRLYPYPARSGSGGCKALRQEEEFTETPVHALQAHAKSCVWRHHLPRVGLVAYLKQKQQARQNVAGVASIH